MKDRPLFLIIGLFVSVVLHGTLFQTVFLNPYALSKHQYQPSVLVPVHTPKPVEKKIIKPKPAPKKIKIKPVKPKQIKKKIQAPPISHIKKQPPKKQIKKKVKPVFGMAKTMKTEEKTPGIGARIGNTLMKEQEEEYTPPEKVEDYYAGDTYEARPIEENKETILSTVPFFELSRMPMFKTKIDPQYPESLKQEGIQGEVVLTVTIDEKGKVVAAKIKSSDHELFSKSALETIFQCEFTPGTHKGHPVATIIDIPIEFEVDT